MSERLRRLAALGLVDLNDWMTDPPVQVTGRIVPEGNAFHLRLRSGAAQLEIHSGQDLAGPVLWNGDSEYDEGTDPCSFSPEVVATAAADLLEPWRSGTRPRPA